MPDHTTTSAARELGISRRQVIKLIHLGRLRAEKPGRDWIISTDEIERYKKERRASGRPIKKTDTVAGE